MKGSMKLMNKDILLCGVGGQGIVLVSKLLAAAATASGEKVHSAETIGMAQRGGSVTSHVRIGAAYSPLIPRGKADLMLAFEPSEAVRNLPYLKEGGTVIVNRVPVKPVTATLQSSSYDGSEMIAYLQKKVEHLIVLDSEELCAPLHSTKVFNVVMLGVAAAAGETGLDAEIIRHEVETRVPARFKEINQRAFSMGRAFIG